MFARDGRFHNDGGPFRESIADGGRKVFRVIHLADAETGARAGGFHEKGQAQFFHGLFAEGFHIVPFPDKGIRGQFHIIGRAQITLAGILVESHRCHESAATGMRDAQHFQVALQEAGFSGRSVLHDIGEVELDLFPEHHHGEIALVHLRLGAFREGLAHGVGFSHGNQFPLSETGENLINVVLELIDTGRSEFSTAACHLPFGGITAVNHGNRLILGHFIRNNNSPNLSFPGLRSPRTRRDCNNCP